MQLAARTLRYLATRYLADPHRSNQHTARANASEANAILQERRREQDHVDAYLRDRFTANPGADVTVPRFVPLDPGDGGVPNVARHRDR